MIYEPNFALNGLKYTIMSYYRFMEFQRFCLDKRQNKIFEYWKILRLNILNKLISNVQIYTIKIHFCMKKPNLKLVRHYFRF